MSKHNIVHIEIATRDREESGRFYNELFGWKIEQLPEMEYATFEPEAPPGGGFNQIQDGFPQGKVLLYVNTDDIAASLRKAKELGAKVIQDCVEIPGMGWWGEFEDPSGTRMAVYTSMRGDSDGEAGPTDASEVEGKRCIIHIDLPTSDRIRSGEFYKQLFGWEITDVPEFEYTTWNAGPLPAGGFNLINEHYPAGRVLVYVNSADIDADLRKAESLGAKVVQECMEIPGIGWWGEFVDPSGSRLAVFKGMPGYNGV